MCWNFKSALYSHLSKYKIFIYNFAQWLATIMSAIKIKIPQLGWNFECCDPKSTAFETAILMHSWKNPFFDQKSVTFEPVIRFGRKF
jgi:hypothetical protein